MESVSNLRAKLRVQAIGKRLSEHQSRPKIAQDLNLRPNQLRKILHSDLFLGYLDEQKSPAFSEVARTIREELKAEKETDAEKLILAVEAEATRELLNQMRDAEKSSDRRAAAIAIIELARKVNASRKDTQADKRLDVQASHLKVMLQAAREQDERPEPVHQNDGEGTAIQPAL
jgi:hypothetical protein